jgi:hypothetical protein
MDKLKITPSKECGIFSIEGLDEIKLLSERKQILSDGSCCGTMYPSPWKTMDKINEIAEKVNILIRIKNTEVNK